MPRASFWQLAIAVVALAAGAPGHAADNRACTLLTPAEIESATGLKIPGLKPGGSLLSATPTASDLCTGTAPNATVMLRIAKRTGPPGMEAKGIEAVKKMGARVEVQTFGPITCSKLVPPANLSAQLPFNTTCTVLKGDTVAGVEITAKNEKDMAPIEKLRPLAEKMAARF